MAAQKIDSRRMGEMQEGKLLLTMAIPLMLSLVVPSLPV